MPIDLNELFKNDPVGNSLIQEACEAFDSNKADRDLLKRVNKETKKIAEDFLNALLVKGLDSPTVDEIRTKLDSNRVERKLKTVSSELLVIYKNLGLIRDFSTQIVELDYPQCLADPLMLRGYPPEIINAVGKTKGVDVEPLVRLIEDAHREMNLHTNIAPELAKDYKDLSAPLLLKYMDISATKVYFMGPVFYGNAEDSWTLTFATGSGLPDPLEWNGALWFMKKYELTAKDLKRHSLKADKNPFRALNFSVGICNKSWNCKRLYVWQKSKTARQAQSAFAVAKEAGKEQLYLQDSVKQLLNVFTTPNLKIIEIEEFSEVLTAWTRLSPKDIMLSCRPGRPEEKIAHGIWMRPGLRLSDEAVDTLKGIFAGIVGASVSPIPMVGSYLSVLASASALYLLGKVISKEEERHRQTVLDLQAKVDEAFLRLWHTNGLPGTVKEENAYIGEDALSAVIKTLVSLHHGLTYKEVLEAYANSSHGNTTSKNLGKD